MLELCFFALGCALGAGLMAAWVVEWGAWPPERKKRGYSAGHTRGDSWLR